MKYVKYTAVLVAVALLPGVFQSAQEEPSVAGQWVTVLDPTDRTGSSDLLMPINPVHAVLLPNGKILFIAGSRNNPTGEYLAAVLDLATGVFTVKRLEIDLFCNAASFLPDGRVLVIGGTVQPGPGERRTAIFDWTREEWVLGPPMADGRWYATVTVLPDGEIVAVSGTNSHEALNMTGEVFTPGIGSWSAPFQTPKLPLYPWGHMFPPDGKVFYSGRPSWIFDPKTLKWREVAGTQYDHGSGTSTKISGTSAQLMLDPRDGYRSKVFVLGGGFPPTPTNTAEVIDLSAEQPAWQSVKPMEEVRTYANATLLPNGFVAVTGGSTDTPLTELFNPETSTWIADARGKFPRGYHSVALLLPDGTVLKAGSNPAEDYERRIEIYSPPYLFTGTARPVITSVPAGIAYEQEFTVGFQSGQITSVVLMRLGADTHGFNMEQRGVRLVFSDPGTGVLSVTAPPDGKIAPPGYYMLFLIDGAGVPSVAQFVQLTGETQTPPPIQIPGQPAVKCLGKAATIVGTSGNDVLIGTSRPDVIHGLGGNDIIFGKGGNDTICGGKGDDHIFGGRGRDTCYGGSGTNTIKGCEKSK
jgi:hypothetical protein